MPLLFWPWIRDRKIRIQDKHPRSTTLHICVKNWIRICTWKICGSTTLYPYNYIDIVILYVCRLCVITWWGTWSGERFRKEGGGDFWSAGLPRHRRYRTTVSRPQRTSAHWAFTNISRDSWGVLLPPPWPTTSIVFVKAYSSVHPRKLILEPMPAGIIYLCIFTIFVCIWLKSLYMYEKITSFTQLNVCF